MPLFKLLIVLLIGIMAAALGIAFALSNSQIVLVHYYVGTWSMPLSLLVLGALVLGLMMGWLSALPSILRAKFQRR
jgi:uncharacterized integral membrane protein